MSAMRLKNRPSNLTFMVLGGIALVVLVAVGFKFFSGRSSKQESERWANLDKISNVDELGVFAAKNAGTTAARTARFEEARFLLKRGVEKLSPDDLKKSRQHLRSADRSEQGHAGPAQECLMNRAPGRGVAFRQRARQPR